MTGDVIIEQDWLIKQNFASHSGKNLTWKIECDGLTDKELQTFAHLIATIVGPFSDVHGVPRGGIRLEEAVRPYITLGSSTLLIVDDVLTTGASMEDAFSRFSLEYDYLKGAVLFARSKPPVWVQAVFQLHPNAPA